MTDYTPIRIPPGLSGGSSPNQNPGTWYDANFVRWIEGVMRPVGGWEAIALTGAIVSSPIRALHTWTDNGGIVRTALLCEQNIYVLESNLLTDITPVGGMTGPAASLTVGGYGEGVYGSDTYGTPRPSSQHVTFAPPWWSIDNFGENLLIMSSYDGRLLQWVPNVVGGSRAAAVSGAPTANRGFLVTPQRYVILFGTGGNFRRFAWNSQPDITNWSFGSITGTAGFFDVEPSSYIIGAKQTRYGILMFTNIESYLISYIGVPYIFNYDPLSSASVPSTPQCIAEYAGKAAWFSGSAFWRYDGSSIVPLPCPLLDWMKDNINPTYNIFRMAAVNLGNVPEIWWHFPTADNTENDHCVIWNFRDNWWSKGHIARTCGENYSYRGYPIMATTSQVFLHERSFYYPGSELPFAQTSNLNKSGAGRLMTAGPILTDNPDSNVDCTYEIITRETRGSNLFERTTGALLPDSEGKVDFRETGRDIFLKIAMAAPGLGDWSIGAPQMKQAVRGSR